MSKLETILSVVAIILAFISSTIIPFTVKLIKAKAEATQNAADIAAAKKAEEIAKKMLAMTHFASEVVISLEKKFEKQDAALKATSPTLSLGFEKRACALAELSKKATEIGLAFDHEHWGKTIDSIVELTRKVNAREKDRQKVE